jgi:uncharacterized membrane protein YccC
MTAVVSNAPQSSSRSKKPDWLHHATAVGLTFALKTYVASMLALYIAFWAGLDDPRWSFLTVFVVSQPDSGLVVAKSFYRILGTIAGLVVTIALVFALAQYGELFVAALTIWICFCNFAARAVRNFASYGFQLAGYTVAIVGIPAALEPNGAYPLVVARFTEIVLGMICAALVSRLILVRELSPKLEELVRSMIRRAERFAAALLDPNADRIRVAEERADLIKSYDAALGMQQSAYFESADARILDQPLRRLTQDAVGLCATAEVAASHRAALEPETQGLSVGLQNSDAKRPVTAKEATITALVRTADERDISLARARLRASMAAFDRGDEPSEPSIAGRLWSDPISAALTGIRSALAIGVTSAFWFATAWPNGPAAVVVAAVVSSLLASMERPDKISMAAAATVLVAAVPVFATQFYLLPLAVDFPSMAVALAPLTLICGFIMAQPGIGPLGLLSAVYFAFASNIDNVMTYDASAFLNSSFAILLGIAVAVVLFATFFPETPAYASRRLHKQVFAHLSDVINASHATLALRCYQRALYEQLGTTLAHVKDDPKAAVECFGNAVTGLSLAQSIGRLRSSLDATKVAPGIVAERSRLLALLSQAVRAPSAWKFSKAAHEARRLGRCGFVAVQRSTDAQEIDAITMLTVGSETLASTLMRESALSEGKQKCSPNSIS